MQRLLVVINRSVMRISCTSAAGQLQTNSTFASLPKAAGGISFESAKKRLNANRLGCTYASSRVMLYGRMFSVIFKKVISETL
jgi:hypothetical protein